MDPVIYVCSEILGQKVFYRFVQQSSSGDFYTNTEYGDITIELNNLYERDFSTFLELAQKVKWDFAKYSSSCLLKARNLHAKLIEGEDAEFDAYFFHTESKDHVYLVLSTTTTPTLYKLVE